MSVYDRVNELSIQDKFKIVDATKEYPLFGRDDINIDNEWCKRIESKITKEELDIILAIK